MEKYEVKQGDTALLNVSARGNPSKISYTWTKDGVPLPGPDDSYSWQETLAHKVFYRGPSLHIYQAQKEDSGDYECEAANSQGSTRTTIIVKVLCKCVWFHSTWLWLNTAFLRFASSTLFKLSTETVHHAIINLILNFITLRAH